MIPGTDVTARMMGCPVFVPLSRRPPLESSGLRQKLEQPSPPPTTTRSRSLSCSSSFIPSHSSYMTVITVIICLVLVMSDVVSCFGPMVKVCGARELKEVTESICSTLGKRDVLSLASLFWKNQRTKRMTASDMAVSCCREACSLSYYALFCD